MQMNIWKIIYLNCGEKYEAMIDNRSYIHKLKQLTNSILKTIIPERDLNSWPECIALPTELSSHVAATHFVSS